jgi:hypothetical protein
MLNKVPFIPWVDRQTVLHCSASCKVYCRLYQCFRLQSSISLTEENEKSVYGYALQTEFIKILIAVTIAIASHVDSNHMHIFLFHNFTLIKWVYLI